MYYLDIYFVFYACCCRSESFNTGEDQLKELLYAGEDIVSIASTLDINVNLLAIKLAEMQKSGLAINLPFTPDRLFMGRIADRADSF